MWSLVRSVSSVCPFGALGFCVTVCSFARAAITQHHRLGGLSNTFIVSQFWRLSPKSRYWQVWFFLMRLLACRWPPSLSVFTWSAWREEVLGVSSYEQLVLSDKGLTHMTLFNFASLKVLSSNLVIVEKVRFKASMQELGKRCGWGTL